MLTRAAADFPNGGWLTINCFDNLQNMIFIVFTGLRKGFMGYVFEGLITFHYFPDLALRDFKNLAGLLSLMSNNMD